MRELNEEREVAGECGQTESDELCDVYQIEHPSLMGNDAAAWAKRGAVCSHLLKLRKQEAPVIAGTEISDEVSGAEILGMDFDEESLGFSFKRAFKRVTNAAKSVTRAPRAALKPAFKLLNAARKRQPAALTSVLAVKQAAQSESEYAPMAQAALENLEEANEIQEQAYADAGNSHAYDPEDTEADTYGEDEPVEMLGFSFKKLVKKAGYALDVTRKENPLRKLVPPQALAAADLVAAANRGVKDAKAKIEAVKEAAKDGNATAQAAAANIKLAESKLPVWTRIWNWLLGK